MRAVAAILLFATAVSWAAAQAGGSKQPPERWCVPGDDGLCEWGAGRRSWSPSLSLEKDTQEPPFPKVACRSSKWAPWFRVKADPPIEERTRFDLSVLTQRHVVFRIGTIVGVSRREGPWSCVTGSVEAPSGWQSWTGWIKSSLLGPMDPPEDGSGISHLCSPNRTSSQRCATASIPR
jgi:hypothetical protein